MCDYNNFRMSSKKEWESRRRVCSNLCIRNYDYLHVEIGEEKKNFLSTKREYIYFGRKTE